MRFLILLSSVSSMLQVVHQADPHGEAVGLLKVQLGVSSLMSTKRSCERSPNLTRATSF
jgi:hypothetical protein